MTDDEFKELIKRIRKDERWGQMCNLIAKDVEKWIDEAKRQEKGEHQE